MRIQYASDLHLEFKENRTNLKGRPLEKSGDILILAGDTIYMTDEYYDLSIFDDWSKMYDKVFMICGNHEFYKLSFPISRIFPFV